MLRASLHRCRFALTMLPAMVGALALSGPVLADPLPLTLISNGAGADVTITYNNPADPAPGYPTGFTLNGFAGTVNLQLGDSGGIVGYCVDLAHFASVGQTFSINAYPTDSPTNGLTNGGQVAYLANAYGGMPLSNAQAAGLQIAIWSELYDNGIGFTSGVFQYTAAENIGDPNYSTIAGFATGYLNDAQGHSSVSTWYDASPNGVGQWRGQSMIDPAVPAPPSLVLFLMGLGCLGVASSWRRRANNFWHIAPGLPGV